MAVTDWLLGIAELREEGMDIITEQHANDNMYAHYSLAKGE